MSWQRDRDVGFEQQFAHQEERTFKAAAHRNRLLAQWAAQKMNLRHHDAESYVQTLVTGDVAHLRGRGIIAKVAHDLTAAGFPTSETEVALEFDRLEAEVRAEARKD